MNKLSPDYSKFEVDLIANSYYSIWRMAQRTCNVIYSGSLGHGCKGAYFASNDESKRTIYIVNESLAGSVDPQVQDVKKMKEDILVLAHELGHATNHKATVGTPADKKFKAALALWLTVKMNGNVLNDDERNAIYMEEVRAEGFGKTLIDTVIPELSFDYDCAIVDNLSSYDSLLWTGKWPDGTPAAGLSTENAFKAFKKLADATKKAA